MAATWKIDRLKYYTSKNNKNNVVHSINYIVSDSKKVEDKTYSYNHNGYLNIDLEIVEAVDAVDAVLYTDKDTLLADKAVKIGDIKTPAVEAVEGKNPWSNVDFVEYDNLTENIVIGWVKSALGEERVKQIEDDIIAQIDAQKNPPAPTEGSGVPW
tara:strand:- start:3712 stop:4179 length:468 start_codon:yes stop_codon:yes gene_type:complete